MVFLGVAICPFHLSTYCALWELRMRTATVNHDRGVVSRACLPNCARSLTDMFGRKVWAFRTAAQDDVYILVSTRFDDGSYTLFGDTHERVGVAARAHRIDSNRHTAISAILEADWE